MRFIKLKLKRIVHFLPTTKMYDSRSSGIFLVTVVEQEENVLLDGTNPKELSYTVEYDQMKVKWC